MPFGQSMQDGYTSRERSQRMSVRIERTHFDVSSRVAPQEFYPVPAFICLGTGFLFVRKREYIFYKGDF